MKKPALKSEASDPSSAVLIVDKIGVVGEKLAEEFSKDFYVVLFSSRIPTSLNKKISFINFKNKIPKVPRNKYSKIFLIDDGRAITKESSFSFIKEARELGADFYFLGSVRNFDIKHTDELVKIYDKTKILVFGDLFDKEFIFDHDSSITKFILEAGNKKKIKVPGDGLAFSYPINFNDTIKLILKAVYLKIPEKIILLFYKSPITDISLAHLFQKIDPDIDIDFEKEIRNQNFFIPKGAEYAISKYDLKQKLEELNIAESKVVLSKIKELKKDNLKFFKFSIVALFMAIFLLTLPLIASLFFLNLGQKQLKDSVGHSQAYEFEKAMEKASSANSFLNLSQGANSILNKQLVIFNKKNISDNLNKKIQKNINFSNTIENIYDSALLYEQIHAEKSIKPGQDFEKILTMIKRSYVDLEKLNIDNSYSDLSKTISSIGLLANTSETLLEVLGFESEKTYLVLFQDSSELRAGGGSITSIAKIKIKDGIMSELEITDIRELDEKLNIHIEPPFPIRRYLPSKDYYLKDSNFDPDFVESAITASTMYDIAVSEKVDGVIGVDLYFLEYLLEKVGPVYMKDLEKNIAADNIHKVASEFDTGQDNDSFITLLLRELEINLNEKNSFSPLLFLEIIEKASKEKHMLFAFKNNEVQSIFTANNLAGSIIDNRQKSEDKINDTFGFYESNLGLNKINYYISRSVSKKNVIEENGNLNSEITIAFKNSSKRGSSFAKIYKNYMQVILPVGVKITDVSIAGKRQDLIPAISDYKVYENPRFSNPKELEINQTTDSNKSIFGFLISIGPDSIQTINIDYSLPFKVSTNSNSKTNYSLLVFKQPGIVSFPFNLVFEQNNNLLILPQGSWSMDIRKDEIIQSTLSKK